MNTPASSGPRVNAPSEWRFSIEVARAWEREFDEAFTDKTRKIALRSAMTLSPDPVGVFDTLLGLARHGLAAPRAMAGSSCRGFTMRTSSQRFVG
jgi:NAD dependent epimerase/dehydratase family enzyme